MEIEALAYFHNALEHAVTRKIMISANEHWYIHIKHMFIFLSSKRSGFRLSEVNNRIIQSNTCELEIPVSLLKYLKVNCFNV